MKIIATLGTVLNSLIRFANSGAADPPMEQNKKKRRNLHPKLACYRQGNSCLSERTR